MTARCGAQRRLPPALTLVASADTDTPWASRDHCSTDRVEAVSRQATSSRKDAMIDPREPGADASRCATAPRAGAALVRTPDDRSLIGCL